METAPIVMPRQFADALCDERNEALYHAELADETNKEIRSLHRYHAMNRKRSISGYACDECRDRAGRIWAKYLVLLGTWKSSAGE